MESVRVIKEFLNLEVGTILHFNEKSGRYEFDSRDEDTSPEYKSISEKSISLEPWLVADNIGKYFSELIIEENMKETPISSAMNVPVTEVEPTEEKWTLDSLTKDLMIAKIHADSAEKIAKIHAESAEKIAEEPTLCVDEVDILATLENLAESLTNLKSKIERLEFLIDKDNG